MAKFIIITLLAFSGYMTAAAQAPATEEVMQAARRVNNYFMRMWLDPKKDTFVRGKNRPSSLWTRGVYYEGLMALYEIDPQERYLKYTDEWADYHKWTPRYGTNTTHADDQCCAQTYLDRYVMERDRRGDKSTAYMTDSVRVNLEKQMATGKTDYWWWIDAIQMAMPVYAKMFAITGDRRYILYARDCYEWTRNREGLSDGTGLWNPKEGLWWRDKSYKPPFKEFDGNNCYWSRGNGWVYEALARTMQAIDDSKTKDKEVADFRNMMAQDFTAMSKTLAECQREDGFWNVSLLSPTTYGGKETSGTGLFLSGMAWGIRKGLLKEDTYDKTADKAAEGLLRHAIAENGFLQWMQGTGAGPESSQPVLQGTIPDFEDYGAGCVLLGLVEYYKLRDRH